MSKAPRIHLQTAWDAVGGLSEPSKMPDYSHSIPAKYCKVGSVLRKVLGSTCGGCYALKGRYVFPNVADALERRYRLLDNPAWVDAMSELINALVKEREYVDSDGNTRTGKHFRWHDAGDIQSVDHLRRIVLVALNTPTVSHWLPTREYRMVADYRKAYGEFPDNLTVRQSAHMIGKPGPLGYGLPVSSVTTTHTMPDASVCEAGTREGKCGPCRACWDVNVAHITYPKH